jgi:protein gp37
VRWVSAEPLLDLITLARWLRGRQLGWVVAGGQSGPNAKPMHPDWARALRDQCDRAGVPFFFKQWGAYVPAHVEDVPGMVGGRAYRDPKTGGLSAPTIRFRGPSGTFRAGTSRLMEPGEATTGRVMLDRDTVAVRVGKHAAGRELDGRTWDDYPAVERPAGVS